MCGIFGVMFHSNDKVPDKERLLDTARLLGHRGPDHYGIYAEAGIGLVHTRLSLLDLSPRSNQPFWDKEGRYCLIYNGEIYNFRELRAELEQEGMEFRTTSDTEVLLAYIISRGINVALPKLEGMFAFAVYDKLEKIVIIARDRFGIKPLFIYDQDKCFIFSSEIEGIRPWINLRPDLLSISAYLYGFGGATKGHSFFEKVKILPPGSVVQLSLGQRAEYDNFFTVADFWDTEEREQLKHLKQRQLVDKLEECLLRSVKQQLLADAPVGALCSGGIDSSLILAMAAKYHNNLAIFHANVVGLYSEYEAAATLARHLKLDLKAVETRDDDVIELMPEVVRHFGQPFYMVPSCTPFLMVSRLVRTNGVKAVLTGEGSDECFLGYNFLVPNIRKLARSSYETLKKLFKAAVLGTRLNTEWDTYASTQVPLTPQRLIMGLHNRFEMALETEDINAHVQSTIKARSYCEEIKTLDLLNYNLRALLLRNDLMGMAASIESRFPFLDTKLVRMAVNMPYDCKIRFSASAFDHNHYFFRDKWLLRKVAERYLPREIWQRSKGEFLVDAFRRMMVLPGFFEKSFLSELFDLSSRETQYLAANASRDLKLKLMHLDTWAQVWMNNVPNEEVVRRLREHVRVKPVLS